MKLEIFFEKFDELADTPAGVKSMRELVLRLAFSGGLTGKRPTEDGVPEGWENRTIESISASISSGFACSRSHQVENGHVHLRTHNISTLGTLNFDLLVRIDPKMVDPQKASIRAGDILFNNTNSQELVGKTSLVDRDYDYGFSNHITRIRLKDGIFPGFVVFYLTLLRNSGYFARLCTRWINQAAVNADTLKEQTIPIPPLAEQKRIVAKVDELMALCDRLEAQQQERETRHAALARASLARFAEAPTPANLEWIFHPSYPIPPADLRKAILTLAVQGKLVHRVVSDSIGSDILRDAKVTEAPPDDVPELPEHWTWARLGSIAIRMDSGWSPACSSEPANIDEWGVLKTTAVQTLQYQEVQNKALPPSLAPRPEHEVLDGDILFTRAGPMNRVGILCVARPTRKKLMISDKIIRIHLVAGIDPDFAALAMNAGHSSNLIEGLKSGMAASQVNISQPKLRSVPIPVPPLAEQRRIVAKVEQLMALVDALETQLAASRATAANLLSALVAERTASASSQTASAVPLAAEDAAPYGRDVEIVTLHSSPEFIRAIFAAEVIHRLRQDTTFGQTKFQKVIYLAEYIAELSEIASEPERFARGPHDPQLIEDAVAKLRKLEWFDQVPRADSDGYRYNALAKAGQHVDAFEKQWPKKAATIRRVIDQMKTWKTERCERFATVYAAWNDLIIWGNPVTDGAILHEVLQNWHPDKRNIPKSNWLETLQWMKTEDFVPKGFGRATQAAPQNELF